MRGAFIDALIAGAQKHEQILLLTGDLGYKVFDPFKERFPSRLINAGVAESFMIGMAAGLALEGYMPFCYSIAPFLVMRPYEFIRNDICFHRANVKLVAVGGGYSYGPNGASHHALNDLALMQSLPEMTVLTPADSHEARWATQMACQHDGPVYIRLGRSQELPVHAGPVRLGLGESVVLKKGTDIALLVSGFILNDALLAWEMLEQKGYRVRVISFPSIKPIDHQAIAKAFDECDWVVSIDEHERFGGFGEAVMHSALKQGLGLKHFVMICKNGDTLHMSGSHEYLRSVAGLGPQTMVDQILGAMSA